MSYSELKKFYDKTRLDYFVMAITHLMDIGWRNAEKITDEEIEKCEGNGLMTKDFVQWIQRTAREITRIADGSVELIQFCEAQDVFDIQNYSDMTPRNRLEEMLLNAISYLGNRGNGVEDIMEILEANEEEMERWGYELEE